jgi:hypothetical protein
MAIRWFLGETQFLLDYAAAFGKLKPFYRDVVHRNFTAPQLPSPGR